MTNSRLSVTTAEHLFSTSTPDVDFLIMRQIIREIGNATMRYGAGINAVSNNNALVIVVTLPLV